MKVKSHALELGAMKRKLKREQIVYLEHKPRKAACRHCESLDHVSTDCPLMKNTIDENQKEQGAGLRGTYKCRKCGETGHNARTCKKEQ